MQKVKEINEQRKFNAPNHTFTCSSYDDIALKNNNDLELSYMDGKINIILNIDGREFNFDLEE